MDSLSNILFYTEQFSEVLRIWGLHLNNNSDISLKNRFIVQLCQHNALKYHFEQVEVSTEQDLFPPAASWFVPK